MPAYNFVGEGSYGCVHRPSLQCKNRKMSYKKKVSKTMTTRNALQEMDEYNIIASADRKKEFYLGKPIKCIPKDSMKNLKQLEKCKILQKHLKTSNIKKLSLLVMDDGGPELKTFSKMLDTLEVNATNKMMVEKFLIELDRMFAGIVLFHENGFLHHDIKPQNVLYDPKKNRTNYIDFGLVRNYQDIMEASRQSDNVLAEYPFWTFPFEIQFLNKKIYDDFADMGIKDKNDFMKYAIEDLHEDADTKFVTAIQVFFEYVSVKCSSTEKNKIIKKYLNEFHEMILEEIYKDNYERFLKRSIETIDVYGLGMTMTFVMSYCKKFIDTSIYDDFTECFYNMTRPNLFKRFDVYEARSTYDAILRKSGFLSDTHTSISSHGVSYTNKRYMKCPKNTKFNEKHNSCSKTCKRGVKCLRSTVKRY